MIHDFDDGDLIISFVHGSYRMTATSKDFDFRQVVQTLTEISRQQKLDHFEIAIKRCRQEPHPVFEGKFVLSGTELFALNLSYHPIGQYFIELRVRYPEGEDGPYRPVSYYPSQDLPRHFMIRRWMGQNYGRIPIDCFIDRSCTDSIVEHFIAFHGQAWPGVRWLDDSAIQWHFYLGPEDDWPNQGEHLRPACQVSLPEAETLRQLGRAMSDFL